MQTVQSHQITISGATENNLKSVSLAIPKNQLVVVTGISGSGKSSLVFDVLAQEGQRRFLETFPSFSRLFMGKLGRPAVERIEGLSPVISIGQKTAGSGIRSTVGTMTDMYDLLRLLYARAGKAPEAVVPRRSLFSFNSPEGACPHCKGIGLEEQISEAKLVAFPDRSIRGGALAPTLPNGYIMYSQVTAEVLDLVCREHGFNVDIPWNQLSRPQQEVVLFGSTRIKVPFGKHPLESRLKWTGITAKPREEGFYKGLIPIMSDILRRDRNDNILRYAESLPCSVCHGKRLNESALSVTVENMNIHQLSEMELSDLAAWFRQRLGNQDTHPVFTNVAESIIRIIENLEPLGLGHLCLSRAADTLSAGDIQRLRLVNQLSSGLSGIIYVFDEPSAGLHSENLSGLIQLFRRLVATGNTVIVVEHDPALIACADTIIDIGPGAGNSGGEIIFSGTYDEFIQAKQLNSPTQQAIAEFFDPPITNSDGAFPGEGFILENCRALNLKNQDIELRYRAVNVVCGPSGSGKTALVEHELGPRAVHLNFDKIIRINRQPIGRSPRSNPATYTGLSDRYRDIFAGLPEAKAAGLGKSDFSFNTGSGRCTHCEGAGRISVGMHFLGDVDVVCPVCNGKRFNRQVLNIYYKNKNIAEILDLTVHESIQFFEEQPAILRQLTALESVGLGYLQPGQSSTTLSGGEAQRLKLASELQRTDTGNTLYILDEPTTGLHPSDIKVLMHALRKITQKGNTVVCIEHDESFIRQADYIVELGPGQGKNGGEVVASGTPSKLIVKPQKKSKLSFSKHNDTQRKDQQPVERHTHIALHGVNTANLKNILVEIPLNTSTAITGVSGSGKTSLALGSLYAEAFSRFSQSMSTYSRSMLKLSNRSRIESVHGLVACVAVSRRFTNHSARSTVGTITGIYDLFRLMYSRIAQQQGKQYPAGFFSFNHQPGACPQCDGLGYVLSCDPGKLISHPEKPITAGAMQTSKPGKFYGDPDGQYIAVLQHIAHESGIDLSQSWNNLPLEFREIALYGTGETIWKAQWNFKNKTREGTHALSTVWKGFCNLVDEEYQRRHLNKSTGGTEQLLARKTCPVCKGKRLVNEALSIVFQGYNISELSELPIGSLPALFNKINDEIMVQELVHSIGLSICNIADIISKLGLDYLSISRSAETLSGGESQRLQLVSAFSAKLSGVCYVIDEPAAGLHPKDAEKIGDIIQSLVNNGNTVVFTGHDSKLTAQAGYIIEMGPGSGNQGGRVLAAGSPPEMKNRPHSASYALIYPQLVPSTQSHKFTPSGFGVHGAYANNLKNISAGFALGGITAVTGVSGSGKTSLVRDVLYASAISKKPVGCKSVYGLENFSDVVYLKQGQNAASSISTPATFTGLLDVLRPVYAATPEAKKLNMKASHFSYVHADGKCPDCNGMGERSISMDFMSELNIPCPTCGGTRYKPSVQSVKIKGVGIGDIMKNGLNDLSDVFKEHREINQMLEIFAKCGIGHLRCGQALSNLSGGEYQRLLLAQKLMQSPRGKCLYIFDEPATGLHPFDIEKLNTLFYELAAQQHSIVMIEHSKCMTAIADQVIELGPEGGPTGGNLIRN